MFVEALVDAVLIHGALQAVVSLIVPDKLLLGDADETGGRQQVCAVEALAFAVPRIHKADVGSGKRGGGNEELALLVHGQVDIAQGSRVQDHFQLQ